MSAVAGVLYTSTLRGRRQGRSSTVRLLLRWPRNTSSECACRLRSVEERSEAKGREVMAWVDDRVWCHPKLTELSDRAFRVWVHSIAYSTGFGTRGRLTPANQRLMGSTPKVRAELVTAGVWDEDAADVVIHDWDDHNAKRDARRAADRERKRKERMSARASAGQSNGQSAGPARVDSSDGSEGSDGSKKTSTTGSSVIYESLDAGRKRELDRILGLVSNKDEGTPGVMAFYAQQLPEGAVAKVRESVERERLKVKAGWVVNALKSELAERAA